MRRAGVRRASGLSFCLVDNTYTLHLIGVLWAALNPYIADKAGA
jgi:hypothetical protein